MLRRKVIVMSGKIYDENFLKNDKAAAEMVDWYEMPCEMFDIHGMLPEKNGILTRRLPLEIAETVSVGVAGQSGYGAGGRILFSTDSAFVALKVEYAAGSVPTVCNHCFSYGFDLYKFDKIGNLVYELIYLFIGLIVIFTSSLLITCLLRTFKNLIFKGCNKLANFRKKCLK